LQKKSVFLIPCFILVIVLTTGISYYAYAQTSQNQGNITIHKTVINDNGGTKKAQDFGFSLEGVYRNGTYFKHVDTFPPNGADYSIDVPIGTLYKIKENPTSDYDTKYGDECSGFVRTDSYCIIVNDDIKPIPYVFQGLEIYEIVNNDHGGTKKAQDFSFNLEAVYPNGTSRKQTIQFSPRGMSYESDLPIGTTYRVTEDPVPGYDTKYVDDCSGIVRADSFCTVVNSDKPPQIMQFQGLEIYKIVNNDHGGTKKAQDFSFNLEFIKPDGSYVKQTIQFSSRGMSYESDLPIGTTYRVTEDPVPGYDAKYVEDCSGIVRADSFCTVVNSDKPNSTQTSIPSWIKNDARWWSDGTLSDKEFATAIGFLVQHKIISAHVATNTDGTVLINDNLLIPSWIKNNARWWSQDTISDGDFTLGIEYIVNHKIISFSEPSILEQITDTNLGAKFANGNSSQNQINNIQIQSRHGSYEALKYEGQDAYHLYASWVLKSNADYKKAHMHLTNPNGSVSEFDANIHDGVIQIDPLVYVTGTYVFQLDNVDGLTLQDNSRIEIVIPSGNYSNSQSVTGSVVTPIQIQSHHGYFNSGVDLNGLDSYDLYASWVIKSNGIDYHKAFVLMTKPNGGTVQLEIPVKDGKVQAEFLGHAVGTYSFVLIGLDDTISPQDNNRILITVTANSDNSAQPLQTTPLQSPQPVINLQLITPTQVVQEATSSSGAIVNYDVSVSGSTTMIAPDCDHKSGTAFPIGITRVTCTIAGSTGHNPASKSFTVTVRDTTPPSISEFQHSEGAKDDSGIVIYFSVTANDLVDGNVDPKCDHISGSKFSYGTTLVTCTAIDSHGNQSKRVLQVSISKS
jgi:hypothetical protein